MNRHITILAMTAMLTTAWPSATYGETRELTLPGHTTEIYGVIHTASDSTVTRHPLAIVAHGFNGTHSSAGRFFDSLDSLGYSTYALDFPNGSIHSRSGNNTMKMSVIDQVNDLKAVIDLLSKRDDVDPDNIILIGESQGGLVSALTANDIPERISHLILVFPALGIAGDWQERYENVEIPDTTRVWNVPIGRKYFDDIRNVNVYENMNRYGRPVLIVQGDADPIVSLAGSRKAVEAYPDAILKVIPGAGHGFNDTEFAIQMRHIKDFLSHSTRP